MLQPLVRLNYWQTDWFNSVINQHARAGKTNLVWGRFKGLETVNHMMAKVITKKESSQVMTPGQWLLLWLRLRGSNRASIPTQDWENETKNKDWGVLVASPNKRSETEGSAIAVNPLHCHRSPTSLCQVQRPIQWTLPLTLQLSWYLHTYSDKRTHKLHLTRSKGHCHNPSKTHHKHYKEDQVSPWLLESSVF